MVPEKGGDGGSSPWGNWGTSSPWEVRELPDVRFRSSSSCCQARHVEPHPYENVGAWFLQLFLILFVVTEDSRQKMRFSIVKIIKNSIFRYENDEQ